MDSKINKIKNFHSAAENEDDSDSDIDLEEFTETSVDVGLIDEDLDDLEEDEVKLYRVQMRSPFFLAK